MAEQQMSDQQVATILVDYLAAHHLGRTIAYQHPDQQVTITGRLLQIIHTPIRAHLTVLTSPPRDHAPQAAVSFEINHEAMVTLTNTDAPDTGTGTTNVRSALSLSATPAGALSLVDLGLGVTVATTAGVKQGELNIITHNQDGTFLVLTPNDHLPRINHDTTVAIHD